MQELAAARLGGRHMYMCKGSETKTEGGDAKGVTGGADAHRACVQTTGNEFSFDDERLFAFRELLISRLHLFEKRLQGDRLTTVVLLKHLFFRVPVRRACNQLGLFRPEERLSRR